jgi:hypothetical protein
MIKDARIGKEIVVTVEDKVGVLAGITSLIADHGISITAVTAAGASGEATIQMLTDDNLRAGDALKAKGYAVNEREVVVVELENKPGALKLLSKKLADDGIGFTYLYGSTCTGSCAANIIFASTNNERAVVALKK